MNGRERIALAMQHREADRVPVMCPLSMGHYFLNTGLPPHRIWFTSDGYADALVRLQHRYRFDGILVSLPGRPEKLLEDAVSIKVEPKGETLTWRSGDVTLFPWDDSPLFFPADGRAQRAAFDQLDPEHLEVDSFADYVWNMYQVPFLPDKAVSELEPPDYYFRAIDLVRERVDKVVSVHGQVHSPFTHLTQLLGTEQALVALMTDRGKAHALLDRLTQASIAWGVAQARHGVDAVLIFSAFAGGSNLSVQMYREFVLPYEARVVKAIRGSGVPVYTHTCGKIGDRLGLIAATGTLGVDGIDEPPVGDADLAGAKETVGDRLFVKGNINPNLLLSLRTKEQVRAAAEESLRDGAPGGGYIMSTACFVPSRVQPWKLELLEPFAEEFAAQHGGRG